MVTRLRRMKTLSAMTIVEVVVTSVLMGVVFTGMVATSTMTMKRISTTAQKENDEKQMDRFQVEFAYYVTRSSSVEIFDSSSNDNSSPSPAGNRVVCVLQADPLEPSDVISVEFIQRSSPRTDGEKPMRELRVQITTASGLLPPYTYTTELEKLPDGVYMFRWTDKGYIEYRWDLDSGYGIESFSGMVAPPVSL